MAETLSQEEIDALRDAVRSGEDLDEAAGVDSAEDGGQIKVTEYNFRRPRVISGDNFHKMRLVHESLGNTLRASLFTTLKTNVEIKLVATDQMTYGEFILSLSNPSYLAVIGTTPDMGEIEMEMNLGIATSMIDILLGGDGSFSFDNRGLTGLEKDILKGVNEIVINDLKTAWSNVADLTFAVTAVESNPEYIQLVRPETPCMTTTFDVHVGELAGILTFCYPAPVIASVFARSEEHAARKKTAEGDKAAAIKSRGVIENVPLDIHAVIGPTGITAEQIESLKSGDIIDLGRRISKPIDVYIESRRAYTAELGQYDGKTAVCLIGPYATQNVTKE